MASYAQNHIRGTPLTGHTRPDPVAQNLRFLAMQLLLQAVRDAKFGERPWDRESALQWLNTPEARGIAGALGLRWGRSRTILTENDLPERVRGTYFRGA